MKVWIFNNYNMLPEHGQLNRAYFFGKYLKKAGHEPVVFVGSHPHNTNLQLIEGHEKYKEAKSCEFPWILVKTCNYEGSKGKRVFSMFQYFFNACRAIRHYERPDAIIGSSAHPLAAVLAITLSKKYNCKGIVEIRDLWPESIVAYGIASRNNPIIKILYGLEKWIYTRADAIIFTMEGGRDYIIEKGWDTAHGGPVDLNKVHHINNGVDLEVFDYNREHYTIEDPDLDNPDTFKVIYTGSVRRVNDIGTLLDVAEELQSSGQNRIKILIYGDGDQRAELEQETKSRGLNNILFKGKVGKEKIPCILSKADATLLHWKPTPITRYGMSMNKTFEYFAAGKPIISNSVSGYDLIKKYDCGIAEDITDTRQYAGNIVRIAELSGERYSQMCSNAKKAAEKYDYATLTQNLLGVIELT